MEKTNEPTQKFVVKLPVALHRQLMMYAGIQGKTLSEIMLQWIEEAWSQQPERAAILEMLGKFKKEP